MLAKGAFYPIHFQPVCRLNSGIFSHHEGIYRRYIAYLTRISTENRTIVIFQLVAYLVLRYLVQTQLYSFGGQRSPQVYKGDGLPSCIKMRLIIIIDLLGWLETLEINGVWLRQPQHISSAAEELFYRSFSCFPIQFWV